MSVKNRVPNFIIGGAPKCATSTIYGWLSDHPAVNASIKKELFYLMDEGHPQLAEINFHNQGVPGFTQFFEPNDQASILMEGTTQYLYQQTALRYAEEHAPHSKFLFVLRDPIKRLWSSFDYARNNLASIDKSVSFSEFLAAARGKGKVGGITGVNDLLPYELEYGKYSNYLERWWEVFQQGRVHVLVFEELIREPQGHMRGLASFLGIDPEFYRDYQFEKKNVSVSIKNQRVHRLAKKMTGILPVGGIKRRLKKIYFSAQTAPGKQGVEITDEDYDFLKEYYTSEKGVLQTKFGLNTGVWFEV